MSAMAVPPTLGAVAVRRSVLPRVKDARWLSQSLNRDNLAVERKLRLEALDLADAFISAAKAALRVSENR